MRPSPWDRARPWHALALWLADDSRRRVRFDHEDGLIIVVLSEGDTERARGRQWSLGGALCQALDAAYTE